MATDQEVAFPKLTAEQIDRLRSWGHVQSAKAGDILFAEGSRDFAFFVVLQGEVEILEGFPQNPHIVTVHEPGEFAGDVDLLTGRASLVTARVRTGGEVLKLDADALQKVVSELPEISEILLNAFLMRRALLIGGDYEGIKIIGSRFSPEAHSSPYHAPSSDFGSMAEIE